MAAKTKKQDISKQPIKLVEELAGQLLNLIGVVAAPQVREDKENEAITVDIQTESEAGLLIGNRGRTIGAIQMVLGMMYRQRTGEWKRVIVNVADWREKEAARLNDLANQTAERVKVTGESQPLYNLNSSQRRIVHLALSQKPDIQTESYGEGKERYLLVSLKK